MEANKKAKELVDKYLEIIDIEDAEHGVTESYYNQYDKAKQCAIIAVDEVLRSFDYHMDTRPRYRTEAQNEAIDLYKKVKQAIKNL